MRMRTTLVAAAVLVVGAVLGWLTAGRIASDVHAQDKQPFADKLYRTVLPIPEPSYLHSTVSDTQMRFADITYAA